MSELLYLLDLVGTIAFAISGSMVGIRWQMDIFGINILAITTATGGGMIRDLLIGSTPPAMFCNPLYVIISILTANIVFLIMTHEKKMPAKIAWLYDRALFWSDTIGLAVFTVDGVMMGIRASQEGNFFLLTVLGFMTGAGGGALRDIFAGQIPYIFRKHIYALATIVGGFITSVLFHWVPNGNIAIIGGASAVIFIRVMADHYKWNLPIANLR